MTGEENDQITLNNNFQSNKDKIYVFIHLKFRNKRIINLFKIDKSI